MGFQSLQFSTISKSMLEVARFPLHIFELFGICTLRQTGCLGERDVDQRRNCCWSCTRRRHSLLDLKTAA